MSGRQDFQGDDAVQFLLPGLVNRAHAALADEFEDLQLREIAGPVPQREAERKSGRVCTGFGFRPKVHARSQADFDETFGAQATRRIGFKRLSTSRTSMLRVHIIAFHPYLSEPRRNVTRGGEKDSSGAGQNAKKVAQFIVHVSGGTHGVGHLGLEPFAGSVPASDAPPLSPRLRTCLRRRPRRRRAGFRGCRSGWV